MATGIAIEAVTEQLENLDVADGIITVNYADSAYGKIQRNNKVESILRDTDVVLFGEGNFTFTVALAAIQGSLSKILSTRFEPATVHDQPPTLDSIKQECVINCLENGEKLKVPQDKIKENIRKIMCLTPPTFALCGIDATRSFLEGKVAWYQCPWVSLRIGPHGSGQLIIDFLKNMARQQRSGDYVLIGITTHFPYVKNYYLEAVLNFTPGITSSKCSSYDFMGADDSFIEKVLQFGYRHQGLKDIHDDIIRSHITLIFKRNANSTKAKK